MNMKKILTSLTLVAGFSMTLMAGSCDIQPTASTKNSEATKAAAAANSISFAAGNAEINNIKRRLELTSDPALMGYIVLFNDMGQPILYATVKGKVTSGSKRLTAPFQETRLGRNGVGEVSSSAFTDEPSDEGTYGSSNPYIYFWTTEGQYVQWSGTYLYSDKPFRLNSTPTVVLTQAAPKQ
jgi:hypothetical protein